jgi:hypothetical protein
VGVGLFLDHLKVAAQFGDELLAGRRPATSPKVAGGKHITDDGLMLCLQRPAGYVLGAPWIHGKQEVSFVALE